MKEITYFVACSVDGFIAHKDGSHNGFSQDEAYLTDLFNDFPETVPTHFRDALGISSENKWFDTVLMGRKTYAVGLKEGVTSPYTHLNQYVFSRSLPTSPDKNVELISNDAVGFVSRLKDQPGQGTWLCGGANLAATLFAHHLIDQLILKVNPFLMGAGIPLFAQGIQQTALTLRDRKVYDNGVVRLHYRLK
ncbi:dihydrofolate reductase [Nodosilinea sp. LEGE 07298]|uniref:dihydrofolate reductase family protein n=1 Tax=Nodosilinea sp. LEGE 07298 TaxID=2777970 RepID=UPI0018811BE8|nr:dihydrofolate reductase family protein [Nodosilinea sp. LEGE 07298]MBE9111705.1 dihydrofolate reductase [Nodosilinea sp. LEGE 07298]